MFGTQWVCTIFCLCLQILLEWIDKVSQDWPLIYWGGGGGEGGQGIQTSPLPYLKFPPPKIFSVASSLESRFIPCSLRNLEYCCVICRYFPCFPLFPTPFRTPPPTLSSPSSRTAPTPFSSGPPPTVLFDCLIIISVYHFSFLSRLFRTKLVVDFFSFITSIWDWSKWHLRLD